MEKMKKRIHKSLLALSALGLACIAVGAANITPVSAEVTACTVDTVAFQMETGASVRLDETGNGIRYHVTMPAAEHTALEANTAYSSVYYGILVAPADYEKTYGELNKANVFGIDKDGNSVTAKYDWAVKNENGDLTYDGDGSKVRIMNFRTGLLTEYTAENGDEMAGYYGSIVDINADNIVRNFVGVGYICYTDAETGKTDYVFAERNDNVRSMAEVARRAIADEDVKADDKATLKETYLEKVYNPYLQFDTQGSKQIVSGAALSWDSIGTDDYAISALVKYDDFDADGVGNEDTTTIGRQDLVIDMGGVYKVKEIRKIVITYRYLNTSDANLHLYVNGIGAGFGEDLNINQRLTGLSYKGTGSWYKPTATDTFATLSIPQTSLKSNSLGASTILTDDDYLKTLTFAQPSWMDSTLAMKNRAEIQIDSIEVVVAQFKSEYLEFNSLASEGVVEQGSNVQIVDLENSNKAVQGTFNNVSGARANFRINLGGAYKVSEIEKVEVSYKVTAGTSGKYWYIYVNDIDYTNDNLRLTGLGFSSLGDVMTDFATFNISQKSLKENSLSGTLLGDDDYLTSISFVNPNWGLSTTIQIDYIRIVLKSAS